MSGGACSLHFDIFDIFDCERMISKIEIKFYFLKLQ